MSARMFSAIAVVVFFIACLFAGGAFADGKMMPSKESARNYRGSIEESSQEAIIIFHAGDEKNEVFGTEDLILKVSVEGESGSLADFAWIIPFPSEPQAFEEDGKLFSELFDYVEWRLRNRRQTRYEKSGEKKDAAKDKGDVQEAVIVYSRKTVGKFDVAVVREVEEGKLNKWLEDNGYQPFAGQDALELLEKYRKNKYYFACVKVKETEGATAADLHPLRFSFSTGTYDSIYYPMRITGLQENPFDINLYIFYRYWINFDNDGLGVAHRGFKLKYRDWDSDECKPNGGKSYSYPSGDPFLRGYHNRLDTVAKLFQKLYPGDKFYLTNIALNNARPRDVLQWNDELWIHPNYVNTTYSESEAYNEDGLLWSGGGTLWWLLLIPAALVGLIFFVVYRGIKAKFRVD